MVPFVHVLTLLNTASTMLPFHPNGVSLRQNTLDIPTSLDESCCCI